VSNQGVLDGQEMWHAWERLEVNKKL